MLKTVSFLLLLGLAATNAAEPAGYYNSVSGLTGAALRTALHGIIDGHTVLSYAPGTQTALEAIDQDPANSANVILIYERTTWPKAAWVGDVAGGWNREHCWPNSLGLDGTGPEYSDLFNLRACGEPANSDRGNLYYDESTVSASGYQRPSGATTALCSQDSDSWEPPDEVKGDLARSMFYMDLRYEGGGEPNLTLTENVASISTSNANMGRLSALLIWHFLDPVSPAERTRAEGAFGYQGNRNPFVDHPEWVEAIYGEVFKLTGVPSANTLTLSWPAVVPASMGFIEVSSDLANWQPATLTIVDVAGKHTATVPLAPAPRYYRLKLTTRPG